MVSHRDLQRFGMLSSRVGNREATFEFTFEEQATSCFAACPPAHLAKAVPLAQCRVAEQHARALFVTDASGRALRFCQQVSLRAELALHRRVAEACGAAPAHVAARPAATHRYR